MWAQTAEHKAQDLSVKGRLNCQSREANPDGQHRCGRLLVIYLAKCQNDRRNGAPENTNEERRPGIVLGDRRVLLGERA